MRHLLCLCEKKIYYENVSNNIVSYYTASHLQYVAYSPFLLWIPNSTEIVNEKLGIQTSDVQDTLNVE